MNDSEKIATIHAAKDVVIALGVQREGAPVDPKAREVFEGACCYLKDQLAPGAAQAAE